MESVKGIIKDYTINTDKSPHRCEREEIIFQFVKGINASRKKSGYRALPAKVIAVRINSHPVLGRSINELRYLWKRCEEDGNFKKFWYFTKVSKEVAIDP